MRTLRDGAVAALAVAGTLALGVTPTVTTATVVQTGTAIIVPGTGDQHPQDIAGLLDNVRDYYVGAFTPSCPAGPGSPCELVPVDYIAQFWPIPLPGWGGLSGAKWNVSVASGVVGLSLQLGMHTPTDDDPVVIFGYSQGATVASLIKRNLHELLQLSPDTFPFDPADLTFVVIGNPNRPNGGLFERLAWLGTVPILDATFGQPTPTDTPFLTHDIALQYDAVADSPRYLFNPLALLNALAGFVYIHGTYLDPNGDTPTPPYGYTPEQIEAAMAAAAAECSAATYCQHRPGTDTYYITLPATRLPIMQPLLDLGALTGTLALIEPLVDLVSPALQVLIETAYDRSDYSRPTPIGLIPFINPFTLLVDLVDAIGRGVHNALEPGLAPLAPPIPVPDNDTDGDLVPDGAAPDADPGPNRVLAHAGAPAAEPAGATGDSAGGPNGDPGATGEFTRTDEPDPDNPDPDEPDTGKPAAVQPGTDRAAAGPRHRWRGPAWSGAARQATEDGDGADHGDGHRPGRHPVGRHAGTGPDRSAA